MKRWGLLGLTAAAVALPLQPATAHPHVWVDTVVGLVFAQDRVTAVELTWTFDGLFTGIMLADFDADQDNALNEAERAQAANNMSTVLAESNFFTHIWLADGAELAIESVQDFDVHLREADNRAVMRFVVPLETPVDPGELTVAAYDASNYVSFSYEEVDPVRFLGDGNLGCIPRLTEDPAKSYYFGLVTPSKVELSCATS